MPTFNFSHEIIRGDDVFEVDVEYTISPFIAATYWQPAEGGEVEIVRVEFNGKVFDVSEAEDQELLEAAEKRSYDDYRDYCNTDWEE